MTIMIMEISITAPLPNITRPKMMLKFNRLIPAHKAIIRSMKYFTISISIFFPSVWPSFSNRPLFTSFSLQLLFQSSQNAFVDTGAFLPLF